MMLMDGTSIPLGAEGSPTPTPSSQTHLQKREEEATHKNDISATTHCEPVPGKWQCLRPVSCLVKWPRHHLYILFLLSICLGS